MLPKHMTGTNNISGSPILQNGKIIGTVTHVLVNNPTRRYGIFIEHMLGEEQFSRRCRLLSFDRCACYTEANHAETEKNDEI